MYRFLGTGFSLPRDQWPELSSWVQEIISVQQSLFELSEAIEELAQNYAARIIQAQQKNKDRNDQPDYVSYYVPGYINRQKAEVVLFETHVHLKQRMRDFQPFGA